MIFSLFLNHPRDADRSVSDGGFISGAIWADSSPSDSRFSGSYIDSYHIQVLAGGFERLFGIMVRNKSGVVIKGHDALPAQPIKDDQRRSIFLVDTRLLVIGSLREKDLSRAVGRLERKLGRDLLELALCLRCVLSPAEICTLFCTADPADWQFWHFSPLEEPISYVESMGCEVRLPPPPPTYRLLSTHPSGLHTHRDATVRWRRQPAEAQLVTDPSTR